MEEEKEQRKRTYCAVEQKEEHEAEVIYIFLISGGVTTCITGRVIPNCKP